MSIGFLRFSGSEGSYFFEKSEKGFFCVMTARSIINFNEGKVVLLKKLVFSSAASAIVTPFSNGKIDYGALERIIDSQIESGISAVVVLGTTGEGATVAYKERKSVLNCVKKAVSKRVPIIAGCASNCTENACKMVKEVSRLDFDGALCVTPYYNKGSEMGLYGHFNALSESSDIPIILYNVPSRTGVDLSLHVIELLAGKENIVGIKEASGSVAKSAEIVSTLGDEMYVYSGCDEVTLPIIAVGGKGAISVLSNLLPEKVSKLCSLAFEGRFKEACAEFSKVLPLVKALFCEVNPIPLKFALSCLGICSDEVRLPLSTLDKTKKRELINIMKECGLSVVQSAYSE